MEDEIELSTFTSGELQGLSEEDVTRLNEGKGKGEGARQEEEEEEEEDEDEEAKLSQFRLFAISSFWLGRNAVASGLVIILLPHQIRQVAASAYRGRLVGLVQFVGAFPSMFLTPIFGMLSDRWVTFNRWGKRIPLVVLAAFALLVVLPLQGSITSGLPRARPDCATGDELSHRAMSHEWTFATTDELRSSGDTQWWRVRAQSASVNESSLPTTTTTMTTTTTLSDTARRCGVVQRNESIRDCEPAPTLRFETALVVSCNFVLQIVDALAVGPYGALIPDCVPPSQYGAASGWMGLMTMIGTLIGGSVISIMLEYTSLFVVYLFLGVLCVVTVVPTWLFSGVVRRRIDEPKPPPFSVRAWAVGLVEPFRLSRNFCYVFVSRLLIVMGIAIIVGFIQYFIEEAIKPPFILFGRIELPSSEAATSAYLATVLIGSVLSSLTSGILSDVFSRKTLVYATGLLMALVSLVLMFLRDFTLTVLLGFVYGAGYGGYISVDWALATDVLPSDKKFAEHLGVWHLALALPYLIGPSIAGFMRDLLEPWGVEHGICNLGYVAIMFSCFMFYTVGTVLLIPLDMEEIERLKRERKDMLRRNKRAAIAGAATVEHVYGVRNTDDNDDDDVEGDEQDDSAVKGTQPLLARA